MSKYYSKKVKIGDHVFDSKKEYSRWLELQGMELAGEIRDLHRQVKFELIPSQKRNGKVVERACYYIADFTYYLGDQFIVEDVKSKITKKKPEYVIKRKLLLYRYGHIIEEV